MPSMDLSEIFVLLFSGFLAGKFLLNWYATLMLAWPGERGEWEKAVLALLPFLALLIIVTTLKTWASFDVVDSLLWISFYTVLGFAWLWLGVLSMSAFFDISWQDDMLNVNNKAALWAFSGGFLGLTVNYAGANVGDGPGWWCVVFTGGLSLALWIALGSLLNHFTDVFERITVEKNLPCGIRFGLFLLLNGILLGNASAGNWTSVQITLVEFAVAWPVLPLTLLAIVIERLCVK